jgi:hypothetical protein
MLRNFYICNEDKAENMGPIGIGRCIQFLFLLFVTVYITQKGLEISLVIGIER